MTDIKRIAVEVLALGLLAACGSDTDYCILGYGKGGFGTCLPPAGYKATGGGVIGGGGGQGVRVAPDKSVSAVKLVVGEKYTLDIVGGQGPFNLESFSSSSAAAVDLNKPVIQAMSSGVTKFVFADQNKLKFTFLVMVE